MFKKLMGTKSKRSNNSDVRTFKVVDAVNTDGCATKFKHGRYTGNPQGAARKAFTRLCNLKNVKGKCTLYITMQETTQGSGKVEMNNDNNKKGRVVKKQKSYLVERVKLKEPVVMFEGTDKEFKRLYATKSKAVKSIPACGKKRPRTRGVRVILFGTESTVLFDPSEGIVHESARAPVVYGIARNEILLGKRDEIAIGNLIGTLERTSRGESPARSALSLIFYWGNCIF